METILIASKDLRFHGANVRQTEYAKLINVTILIPAYNEEATIIQLLEKVKAVGVEGFSLEVLVIDDGSSDKTVELLDARPDLTPA